MQMVGSDLVEEDILPITAFCREVFEIAILTDSMLQAQLLPELTTNCDHVRNTRTPTSTTRQ